LALADRDRHDIRGARRASFTQEIAGSNPMGAAANRPSLLKICTVGLLGAVEMRVDEPFWPRL
jgi:hypothetical protein